MSKSLVNEPLRVGLYLRISQDATGEQLGVARQREDCCELCEREGWVIANVYTDNDVSAYKVRPGYNQMLKDIEAGLIDVVVAWAPDRIYRRITDLEALITIIEKHGVMVKTVKQGDLDLGSAYGRMIARILGSVASGEGEIKSERWRRSIRQRREAGVMPGSGPRMKGWTRDGQLIEAEAEEIRWMAQQVVEGISLRQLAFAARDRDIRSTADNIMPTQSLRRLMLNPRLAGYSVLKGEIIGTGTWPAILDKETWETVRSLLTASGTRAPLARVSSLTGLIFCGGCGAKMVTGSRTMKGGGLSRTYRCTRNAEGQGCMKVSMAANLIEELVEQYAEERLTDPAVRARLDELRSVPKREVAEMTAMSERLIELERQLDDPSVPVEAIVRAMDRTKARIEELSLVIAGTNATPLPTKGAPWPTDVSKRRALVGLVVKRVTIQPNPKAGIVDLGRILVDAR